MTQRAESQWARRRERERRTLVKAIARAENDGYRTELKMVEAMRRSDQFGYDRTFEAHRAALNAVESLRRTLREHDRRTARGMMWLGWESPLSW